MCQLFLSFLCNICRDRKREKGGGRGENSKAMVKAARVRSLSVDSSHFESHCDKKRHRNLIKRASSSDRT